MKKQWIRYTLIALLVALAVMQFFPIDKTNPPVDPEKDYITMTNPPAQMANLIKAACYDCHSDEVKYPWYTNVAPLSYWIKGHIDNGRKKLNFSVWGDYKASKQEHKLEECVEFVEETKMPLASYNIMHPEARMSDEERADMVAWFKRDQ